MLDVVVDERPYTLNRQKPSYSYILNPKATEPSWPSGLSVEPLRICWKMQPPSTKSHRILHQILCCQEDIEAKDADREESLRAS